MLLLNTNIARFRVFWVKLMSFAFLITNQLLKETKETNQMISLSRTNLHCLPAAIGLIVTFISRPGQSLTDPCDEAVYELIDMHEGRRESNYRPEDSDPIHCDLSIEGEFISVIINKLTSMRDVSQACTIWSI